MSSPRLPVAVVKVSLNNSGVNHLHGFSAEVAVHFCLNQTANRLGDRRKAEYHLPNRIGAARGQIKRQGGWPEVAFCKRPNFDGHR